MYLFYYQQITYLFYYQQIMYLFYLFYYQQIMYLFYLFYHQQIMYLFYLFYYQQIMYLFSLLSYIRSIARNKMKHHLNSTQYENTMRTSLVKNCIKYFPFGMNKQKQPVTFIDVPVPSQERGEVMYMCVYLC